MLLWVLQPFIGFRVWRCSSPWLSLYAPFCAAWKRLSLTIKSNSKKGVLKTKVRCFGTNYCLIDRDRWCLPKWKHSIETPKNPLFLWNNARSAFQKMTASKPLQTIWVISKALCDCYNCPNELNLNFPPIFKSIVYKNIFSAVNPFRPVLKSKWNYYIADFKQKSQEI